jgi:death on curing protein
MNDPVFLTLEEVLYIQSFEADRTGSPTIVRDHGALEAALAAPQASFDGQYLLDIFEMAAAYATAIAHHHPFLDANKRCAAGSALAFLSINGYRVEERRDEELADILLDYLNKVATKESLAQYFRDRSIVKEA